jgi:hypothetical protein
LRRVAAGYKKRVHLSTPWNRLTNDELWIRVLTQVVVIGRAEPGDRLRNDSETRASLSIRKLRTFHTDTTFQKYLHKVFVELTVRYVGRDWRTDWKAEASVHNFRVLMKEGGPKKFFEKQIASLETEQERIEMLRTTFKGYGNKCARDTLIELRLASNCMALDTRIFGVLKKVGVRVGPDDIYKQIEKELREKVAEPLGISASLLDRILFRKYDQILERL